MNTNNECKFDVESCSLILLCVLCVGIVVFTYGYLIGMDFIMSFFGLFVPYSILFIFWVFYLLYDKDNTLRDKNE